MNLPSGFLLLDKPPGPTSHDMIDRVRRVTGERRVGHAGTLDPFASGLLIVAVGREATKQLSAFVGLPKTYEAVFVLGAHTDTDDGTGTVLESAPPETLARITEEQIHKALESFRGTLRQRPPDYAAIKVKGKKLYELARAGKAIPELTREITVTSFELLERLPEGPDGLIRIRAKICCSSGTYIRSLARDLGDLLGVGGYVEELRRTQIGNFSVEQASELPKT